MPKLTSIDDEILLEQKLMQILLESRQSLEQSDKITFGNTHVSQMKQHCHNINRTVAEALRLLGKINDN